MFGCWSDLEKNSEDSCETGLLRTDKVQSKDIIIRHLTRKLANWIYTHFLLYTVLLLGNIFLTYN